VRLLNQGNNHIFISGITQSGKSYFAHRAMLSLPGTVLYMNIQGEAVPKGFVTVYSSMVESSQLIDMLKDGLKINFVFKDVRKGYKITSGYVFDLLMESGFSESNPIYVGVDECHLLEGFSLEMARYVSTAGLKKGVRCIWITQRPANCHKALYTQAAEQYIFFLSVSEAAYMRVKGIDFDYCQKHWGLREYHKYCYFDGANLVGCEALT